MNWVLCVSFHCLQILILSSAYEPHSYGSRTHFHVSSADIDSLLLRVKNAGQQSSSNQCEWEVLESLPISPEWTLPLQELSERVHQTASIISRFQQHNLLNASSYNGIVETLLENIVDTSDRVVYSAIINVTNHVSMSYRKHNHTKFHSNLSEIIDQKVDPFWLANLVNHSISTHHDPLDFREDERSEWLPPFYDCVATHRWLLTTSSPIYNIRSHSATPV